MAEPRRHDDAAGGANRDSRVESLLVEGLEQYFTGRFEEAIHLWTRVLFLDRAHARARAYIDRARGAMAERQRRAEAMLQESDDLLSQGQTAAARHLLAEAIATTGDDERAAALRVKLERAERAAVPPPAALRDPVLPVPGRAWPRSLPARRLAVWTASAGLVLLVAIGMFTSADVQSWLRFPAADRTLVPATPGRLPAMSSGEVALVRARALHSRGRLAEALRALERVSVDSPVRAAADQLRVEIQQMLLAGSAASDPARRPGETVQR
jgi:hypothetical protein